MENFVNFFFNVQQHLIGPGTPHYRGFTITLSYTHHNL